MIFKNKKFKKLDRKWRIMYFNMPDGFWKITANEYYPKKMNKEGIICPK
jgi:hypothetical protein